MNVAEEIIRDLPKGLINWYEFKPNSRILFVGQPEHPLAEAVCEKGCIMICEDFSEIAKAEWQSENANKYDYVVVDRIIEKEKDPKKALSMFLSLIKSGGVLLLSVNNRLGTRYFCGDRDPYTKRNFDGVEGYRRAYTKPEDVFEGRMYSKAELKMMLKESGWDYSYFYSVFSDLDNPSLLLYEDYIPNEDLTNRVFPTYNYPDTVFLEEEGLYKGLLENGMFHQMANAYFVICSQNEMEIDVYQVTNSTERGKKEAMQTMICKPGVVQKKPLYDEGKIKVQALLANSAELEKRGIRVVDAQIQDGVYTMPYMICETGQKHLKKLLFEDKEAFLKEMDHFRDLIFQTSEISKEDCGDGEGVILKRGYLDFVPLNSFYVDGEFIFFDQEFCVEECPVNLLLWRMIGSFYAGDMDAQKTMPRDDLLKRYGLYESQTKWQKLENEFLVELLKRKPLRFYHEKWRRNFEMVNFNRQRLNYSSEEYQRIFVDIFNHADDRKLILFGSGNYTKRFLELYQNVYPPFAIVDNRAEKWGQEIGGVKICSPDILKDMHHAEYKVIICIKNYLSVMKQLDEMGVMEYGIYDAGKDYPLKRRRDTETDAIPLLQRENKKYHTGYIAGVFDLFHIGHLNMFKRAKEQCDYLIVGVVPDERVEKIKNKKPFIPFEERVEMVRSCRYVDEVVKIPENYGGTRDAWRLYHFDCQFSGSDYMDNPDWLNTREFLHKHGAEMEFFPYTEQTSSTKIKALIEKGLL